MVDGRGGHERPAPSGLVRVCERPWLPSPIFAKTVWAGTGGGVLRSGLRRRVVAPGKERGRQVSKFRFEVSEPSRCPWRFTRSQTERLCSAGCPAPVRLALRSCLRVPELPLTPSFLLWGSARVCVCVCVRMCVHTCACLHVCARLHTCMCVRLCPHMHVHVCVCLHMHMCVNLHVCVHVCVRMRFFCVNMCVHVFLCVRVCPHVCVCTCLLSSPHFPGERRHRALGCEEGAEVRRGRTGGPISDAQDSHHPRPRPEPLQGVKTTLTGCRACSGSLGTCSFLLGLTSV